MDARLRALERAWRAGRDPVAGARFLAAQDRPPWEALRHPILEDRAVRRAHAELLGDSELGRLLRAQLELESADRELSKAELSRLVHLEASLLERFGEEWAGPEHRASRRVYLAGDPEGDRRGFARADAPDHAWEFHDGRLRRLPMVLRPMLFAQDPSAYLGPGDPPGLVGAARMRPEDLPPEMQLMIAILGSSDPALIAERPELARITDLSLNGDGVDSAPARELLASPHLGALTRLRLNNIPLDPELLELISTRDAFKNLRTLQLFGDPDMARTLDDAWAQRIAASPALQGVEELALTYGSLSGAGASALTGAGGLPRLTALDLSGNPIGDEALERWSRETGLGGLEELDLSDCGIGAGAAALLASESARGLRALGLGGLGGLRGLFPEGLRLPELRHLDLTGSLDAAGFEALASADLPRLTSLDLGEGPWPDDGALLRSGFLSGLSELGLAQVGGLGSALPGLLSEDGAASLLDLRISSEEAEAIRALGERASSPSLALLNVLDLSGCEELELADLARRLVASPALERLTVIALPPGQEEALEILCERWGERVVVPKESEFEAIESARRDG